jgi:flavin-binding protein dodecin
MAEKQTPQLQDAIGEYASYTDNEQPLFVPWKRLCLPGKKSETCSNHKRRASMSVAKVSELIVSSPKSFDDAIKVGLVRAQKTLRNIKSAWVESQQVNLDDKGQIAEYRVQLKITFVLED